MKPKKKRPSAPTPSQPPESLAIPASVGKKGWSCIGPGCYVRSTYTDDQQS